MAGHNDKTLIVTQAEAVRILGVSVRSFERLKAAGVLTEHTPRAGRRASTYDVAALVQQYLAHREAQVAEHAENPRDRRDTAVAEWTELRIARERRLLLPRGEVVTEGHRYIAAVQARLRAIVARLGQDGVDAAVVAKVSGFLEEAIEEFAGWQTSLDLLAADEETA